MGETMSTPGAAMSTDAPRLEKSPMLLSDCAGPPVRHEFVAAPGWQEAATEMTSGSPLGMTSSRTSSPGPSLPAENTVTTPASSTWPRISASGS